MNLTYDEKRVKIILELISGNFVVIAICKSIREIEASWKAQNLLWIQFKILLKLRKLNLDN